MEGVRWSVTVRGKGVTNDRNVAEQMSFHGVPLSFRKVAELIPFPTIIPIIVTKDKLHNSAKLQR